MASKTRLDQYKIEHYDEIVKQRDALAQFVGKFVDMFHAGDCNTWGMDEFNFCDFKNIKSWYDRSQYIYKRNYYLGRLNRFIKKNIEPFFDMSISSDKIKLTPEYIQALSMLKDLKNDEGDFDLPPGKKITPAEVCKMLIMFGSEYRFGHKYPGADMAVYAEAFSDILRCALYAMKVKNDPKAIREFACKCIDEAKQKAKPKRK